MNESVYRWLLGATVVSGMVVSLYFRGKADKAGGKVKRRRDGPVVVVIQLVFGIGAMGGILVYLVHPPWMAWSQLDLPSWLRLLGGGLGVISVFLFLWVLVHLGNNVTPTAETRVHHELVTSGPYRWVRHPLYSSGFVLFTAYFLLTANWFILLACVVGFGMLSVRTHREEANLIERFGDEYREYMKRTPRYLPGVGRQNGN